MKKQNNTSKKIVIIGAGLGGLATALALISQGFQVQIYEKAKAFRPVGTGLGLSPNGLNSLEAIQPGIVEALKRVGTEIETLRIRKSTGELVMENPVQFEKKYGQPLVGIWWSQLQQVLASYLPSDIIHFDRYCVGFEEHENNISIFFSGNRKVEADLLIGADGINSEVRKCLDKDTNPHSSGSLSWRAVVQYDSSLFPFNILDFSPENSFTWMSSSNEVLKFLSIFHLGNGYLSWALRGLAKESSQSASREEIKEGILDHLEDWAEPVQSLVKATRAEQILERPICDLLPLERWWKGRVVLLGDAAHAMVPAMGQGASIAFEDACILGQCLAEIPQIEIALADFQKRRLERTTILQTRSAMTEKPIYKDSQYSAKFEEKVKSQTMEEAEFRDWLYGYQPVFNVNNN